jgi:hypothetical protein
MPFAKQQKHDFTPATISKIGPTKQAYAESSATRGVSILERGRILERVYCNLSIDNPVDLPVFLKMNRSIG